MKTYLILNGANLDRLGRREPSLYGTGTLADLEGDLRAFAAEQGIALEFFQSNIEGELVNALHDMDDRLDGCVLNAGAYSHTSYAIRDAIAGADKPVVEVHLTNIFAREAFRHESVTAPVCRGVVAGFGFTGYRLALEALMAENRKRT